MPSFLFFPHVFYILGLFSLLRCNLVEDMSEFANVYHQRYSCVCDDFNPKSPEYTDSNFVNTTENVRCCKGSPRCKTDGNGLSWRQESRKYDSMICFSDLSCLVNTKTYPSTSLLSCTKKANNCSIVYYQVMNISNDQGETSDYQCFWVSHLNSSLCLLPECQSFAVVERTCDCLPHQTRCTCFGTDNHSNPTYALFFSFKDIFVSKTYSFSYPLLTILLCILGVLGLLIFVQFGKPLKVFICSSTSCPSCCVKRNVDTTVPSISTNRANSDMKVEVSVIPVGDRENDNSTLPSYDEAVKTAKVLSVEAPPKYHEAVI